MCVCVCVCVSMPPLPRAPPRRAQALALRIPFAVAPCCVFPSLFLHRRLKGRTVSSYPDFVAYLRLKHPSIRVAQLDPHGGERGDGQDHGGGGGTDGGGSNVRSTVLYMTQADYAQAT